MAVVASRRGVVARIGASCSFGDVAIGFAGCSRSAGVDIANAARRGHGRRASAMASRRRVEAIRGTRRCVPPTPYRACRQAANIGRFELVEARDDRPPPAIVAFLDGHPNGERFQLEEGVGDVLHLLARDGGDAEAAVIFEDDEPFGDQPHRRFTKRAQAGVVAFCRSA